VLYLGVDGGMTKTIALACGADGRISGHARAGSSDVYSAYNRLRTHIIQRLQ